MFDTLVAHLGPLIKTYGAWGVLFATTIEETFAPIPSTLVVFTSSLFMTRGLHGQEALFVIFFKIMLPASLGLTIGSLVPYFIARIGEKVAIDRFGKFFGITWSTIEKLQAWTKKTSSDEVIIFFSRAIPGLPSLAVSIVAGLARIGIWEYVIYTFLGGLVRSFLIAMAAWWGGREARGIIEMAGNIQNTLLLTVLVVVLGILVFKLIAGRRKA
jgi:membrane protein DedA with SNARE-associated domain